MLPIDVSSASVGNFLAILTNQVNVNITLRIAILISKNYCLVY